MKLPKIPKNTLFIILEGIAAAVVLNLYNPYVQMFAKRMGAGDIHIALINSLPPLVAVLVLIPCSIYIERLKNKKQVVCFLIFINSLFYAAIAFVPCIPHGMRLITYVLLIGLMNWPGSLYTTVWQSFFSGVYRNGEAGFVYSLRSKYGTIFGLVTALATGYILSALPGSDTGRIIIYQVFYAVCFAVSIIQALFLLRVEQAVTEKNTAGIRQSGVFNRENFKELFANKRFMIFSLCAFFFYVTWQMGWPLFFIYNVNLVKMNEFQLSLISVAGGLTSFLSYSMWNRLVDKKGSGYAVIFGAAGLALNPILYITTLNFPFIVLINSMAGMCAAGFTFTLFCGLLENLPEDKKTVYISVFNTLINISGFASPLLGVWIYSYMGIRQTLFAIGILRLCAAAALLYRWYMDRRRCTVCKPDMKGKGLGV